jgi:DNA-binding CsgD family transcriptional regulator
MAVRRDRRSEDAAAGEWPSTSYRPSAIATEPKTARATVSRTPAETRVLTRLATDRTLAAIGDELGIGRPTGKTHVQDIYKKLGANTRAEAVQRAQRDQAGYRRETSPSEPARPTRRT